MEETETKKCSSCGKGPLRFAGYTHEEKVGRYTVRDASGFATRCDACCEAELSADELAGYERRAARTVLTSGQPVAGDVLKYARKALGLRQADLAELFEVTPETVSRWESQPEGQIDRGRQLAMAELLSLVEQHGEGILEAIRMPQNPPPSVLQVRCGTR